jgi:hypothetical protein
MFPEEKKMRYELSCSRRKARETSAREVRV